MEIKFLQAESYLSLERNGGFENMKQVEMLPDAVPNAGKDESSWETQVYQAVEALEQCAVAYPKNGDGKSIDLFLDDYQRIMRPVLEALPNSIQLQSQTCYSIEIENEYFGPDRNYVWLNSMGFIVGYNGDIGSCGNADKFWKKRKEIPAWYQKALSSVSEVHVSKNCRSLTPGFWNAMQIQHLFVPGAPTYLPQGIGKYCGFFPGNLTIHARPGSYAECYAYRFGYKFEPMMPRVCDNSKNRYLFSLEFWGVPNERCDEYIHFSCAEGILYLALEWQPTSYRNIDWEWSFWDSGFFGDGDKCRYRSYYDWGYIAGDLAHAVMQKYAPGKYKKYRDLFRKEADTYKNALAECGKHRLLEYNEDQASVIENDLAAWNHTLYFPGGIIK